MYVIVWEFVIRAETAAAFEAAYGPRGEWAMLFARAQGYRGTQLLRDASNPLRYVTMDSWKSRETYDIFRRKHEGEYKGLDERCRRLTVKERKIGEFERGS